MPEYHTGEVNPINPEWVAATHEARFCFHPSVGAPAPHIPPDPLVHPPLVPSPEWAARRHRVAMKYARLRREASGEPFRFKRAFRRKLIKRMADFRIHLSHNTGRMVFRSIERFPDMTRPMTSLTEQAAGPNMYGGATGSLFKSLPD